MSEIVKKERQSNFELLRIKSMMMIVTLHMLFNEGILSSVDSKSGFILGWILEALCIVAANIYVLISGYFSIDSKFSWKKFFKLWLTVLFYSYGFSFLLFFFRNNFDIVYSIKNIKLVSCPVIFGEYWFVTIYMMLYLLSPYLNILIKNLSKKDYRNLILISVIGLTLIKTIIPASYTFDKTGGYGIIWFIILYLIAGYIRLHYDEERKINHNWYLLSYIVISSIIAFVKIYSELKGVSPFLSNYTGTLFDYNHILVLLASLSLFLYFRDFKVKNNKFINTISKATFGVYLIHEQFYVRTVLWNSLIPVGEKVSSPYLILYIILYVLIIYSIATIIELIREWLVKLIYKIIDKCKNIKESKK